MNPYYFLYYKVYSFLEAINILVKNTSIEWSAMVIVTILIGLNFFTSLVIIELEYNIIVLRSEAIGVMTIALPMIANYFIFSHKQRYKQIIKGYAKKDSFIGGVFTLIYIVATVWSTLIYVTEHR